MAFNLLSTDLWYVALRLVFDSPNSSTFGSLLCQNYGSIAASCNQKFKKLLAGCRIICIVIMCYIKAQSGMFDRDVILKNEGEISLNAEIRV